MICTAAEVAAHAGRASLTVAETAAVTTQIAIYQADLEATLGRGVEKVARTETVLASCALDRFYARYGPVHAITSVTIGGIVQQASHYERSRDGLLLYSGFYEPGIDMVVVYLGGHDTPANLPAKGAVMARTARWLNKRTDDDVGTETSAVEGHSVKWMVDAFTEAELNACHRLRAPDFAY